MDGKPERDDPVETWLAQKVQMAELAHCRQEAFHYRRLLNEYREKADREDVLV